MRAGRITAAVLLILAACSDEPTSSPSRAADELTPDLGSDGPLHGLVLTAETEPEGAFGDPQLAFTTDDTEVAALVALGTEVEEASELTVTWNRWGSFDKREELFSHEITVGPGGQAFSQGVSASGLAPGVYETVATLGERQVRTPWVVREATATGPTSAGGAGGALALFAPVAQAFSGEDWETPSAGDSGWNEPEAPPTEEAAPGPCRLVSVGAGFVPMASSNGYLGWIGECSAATLSATVSGPPVEVAGQRTALSGQGFLRAVTETCDLPEGSDLPGTVVKWTGDAGEGGSQSDSVTLPDFGELLQAVIQAPDNTPTRVDPGYRIVLRGMAVVVPPALGVEKLDVTVGDQILNSVGNASETAQPQPCDPGRLGAVNRTSYTVPQSPPPIIDICAKARGFDGTEAESCIQFYTGEVWKGTWSNESGFDTGGQGCTPAFVPYRGEITFVVSADGSVSGEARFANDPYTCKGGAIPSVPTGPGEISGTRTETGFVLDFFDPGGPMRMTRVGNEATGRIVLQTGLGETIHAWTVRCVSCGS